MKRKIPSGDGHEAAPLERTVPPPAEVHLPLTTAVNRGSVQAVVRTGDHVTAGDMVAQGESIVIHASISGIVERVDSHEIVLRRDNRLTGTSSAAPAPPAPPDRAALPGFARSMGLAGMGGSMFPASIKLKAAERIHTLVINAVECEPGIQIDEALLLHETETVRAGLDCLTGALGIDRVVLAVKKANARRVAAFTAACRADILQMPNAYPGGAEKLIVARLERRMPPTGMLPVQLGFLVFSVASLWALGRRLLLGEPSILRPLTLIAPPHITRNLLVPIGTTIRHLLETSGVQMESGTHWIIAGGLMMGRRTDVDAPVLKGTNAIFVMPVSRRLEKKEEPCILCGSCFDACPLNLHPSGMADRLKEKRYSTALAAQLEECFLCGACSAVCPSEIPLVQYFREGKAWIRKQA